MGFHSPAHSSANTLKPEGTAQKCSTQEPPSSSDFLFACCTPAQGERGFLIYLPLSSPSPDLESASPAPSAVRGYRFATSALVPVRATEKVPYLKRLDCNRKPWCHRSSLSIRKKGLPLDRASCGNSQGTGPSLGTLLRH